MSLAKPLLMDLEVERVATRKVLERIQDDKFEWSPHEKSMTFGRLASHVADIPGWVTMTIDDDELVLGADSPPPVQFRSAAELVEYFNSKMDAAKSSLENVSDERMLGHWQMKMGEQVLIDAPRVDVIRRWVVNHLIHHRAQLAVYLRLNDIPVPAIYGASADENDM